MSNDTRKFVYLSCTGYASSSKNIKTVHLWSDVFAKKAEIFYYGTSTRNTSEWVVDLERAGTSETILVNTYPGVSVEVKAQLEKDKDKVFKLFQELCAQYPDKNVFTVDVGDLCEVTEESFKRYNINPTNKHEMFIFRDFEKGNKQPEKIYLIEVKDSKEFKETTSVQTWASHWMLPTAEKATELGKYLGFLLIRSTLDGKLVKRCEYALKNTEFPSLPTADIPSFYNMSELEKLAVSSGANKIERVGGHFVDKGAESTEIVVVDDYTSVFTDEPGMKSLENKIVRDVLDKGCVYYSDMICFGVPETLRLIQTDKLIPVNMDMMGLARKMVVFAGFVYAIPWNTSAEAIANLAGDIGELLVVSTEESIPQILH